MPVVLDKLNKNTNFMQISLVPRGLNLGVCNVIDTDNSQGFGFESKGTEALSFRQVHGCFFQAHAKSTH